MKHEGVLPLEPRPEPSPMSTDDIVAVDVSEPLVRVSVVRRLRAYLDGGGSWPASAVADRMVDGLVRDRRH